MRRQSVEERPPGAPSGCKPRGLAKPAGAAALLLMVAATVSAGTVGALAEGLGQSGVAASGPVTAGGEDGHDVAEPDGYRMDDYRKPVPKTLEGARVITTEEAEAMVADGKAVFIDVYPRAPKPPNLPAGTLWRDPPHSSMEGAHWLPNVGYGALPPEDDAYFRRSLERLTGGDPARSVVFFCLRDCLMSWNAGKRAMTYGYTSVIWFPEGTDGWQEAGNPIAAIKPSP